MCNVETWLCDWVSRKHDRQVNRFYAYPFGSGSYSPTPKLGGYFSRRRNTHTARNIVQHSTTILVHNKVISVFGLSRAVHGIDRQSQFPVVGTPVSQAPPPSGTQRARQSRTFIERQAYLTSKIFQRMSHTALSSNHGHEAVDQAIPSRLIRIDVESERNNDIPVSKSASSHKL